MAKEEYTQERGKDSKGEDPKEDLRGRLLLKDRVFLSNVSLMGELTTSKHPVYPKSLATEGIDYLGDTLSLKYAAKENGISYELPDQERSQARAETIVTYLNNVLPTTEQLKSVLSDGEAARTLMTAQDSIRGYRYMNLLLNEDVDKLLMALPEEQFDVFMRAIDTEKADVLVSDEEMVRLRAFNSYSIGEDLPEDSATGYFLKLYEHSLSRIESFNYFPDTAKMPIEEALQKVNERFMSQSSENTSNSTNN